MLYIGDSRAPIPSAKSAWVSSGSRGRPNCKPCSGKGSRKSCSWSRLNTGIAARSLAELSASNSFSSQWFNGNVCRSATTNRRRYCHNCCASLGTNLGSPSIVFIIQYVEVLHRLRSRERPAGSAMTLTSDSAEHLSDTPIGATKKCEERADSQVRWVQTPLASWDPQTCQARRGEQVDVGTQSPAIIEQ